MKCTVCKQNKEVDRERARKEVMGLDRNYPKVSSEIWNWV